MRHRIPFFLALRLSVRRFQMPLKGLSFVKTLVTLGHNYKSDQPSQNMTVVPRLTCLLYF